MPPREAFLSHSSVDRAMAEQIAETLRLHGVPTFYSPKNIVGHQQWQDEILQALQRCDWFLVLLSPEAMRSMWVKRETAFALSERRYNDTIVPLNYRDCDLGPLEWLKLYQFVDFRTDFSHGARELLRAWGLGLKS
jgi:hypothetical protein